MAEKFDTYVDRYDALHRASVTSSGEGPEYFHQYKLDCLERMGIPATGPTLDFGCGTGNLTERLVRTHAEVHGYDPSTESITAARERAPAATFHTSLETLPRGHFETAIMSGVLHHVPPSKRADVTQTVRQSLRPGGRVVVFEHNPLNPLTRRAVAACEFDDDAILLFPWEARGLLRASGFTEIELRFIVFFPKALARLRPLEPSLSWCPLGAQHMLVGRR